MARLLSWQTKAVKARYEHLANDEFLPARRQMTRSRQSYEKIPGKSISNL